jgi:hypothetical protein
MRYPPRGEGFDSDYFLLVGFPKVIAIPTILLELSNSSAALRYSLALRKNPIACC